MSSIAFWRKHSATASSKGQASQERQARSKQAGGGSTPDETKVGADLLHHLSYLSAVSAAGIPRAQIFQMAAKLPTSVARYFAEVDNIARSMNYQYAEACRIVGENTKNEEVKGLLLRMAGAMDAGESEIDFMAHEAHVLAESYGHLYERRLESLQKWTDAYAALVVSAVLIVVIATVSTLIYDLGAGVLMGLASLTVILTGMGAWIIYRSAPYEFTAITGRQGHLSQKSPRLLTRILAPAAIIFAMLLIAAQAPFGLVLIFIAILLLPIGIAANRLDVRLVKRENDFGTFLRVLGATATAIGTTPGEAIGKVNRRSLVALGSSIRNLQLRLLARASPEVCWNRFVEETGSDLIRRGTQTFVDGVRLGGDPEEVGNRASVLTMKINYLRAKRKLVSSTFGWLAVGLHATTSFLLVFVIQIVAGFGDLVQSTGVQSLATGGGAAGGIGNVFSFNFANMAMMQAITIPIILALTIINAFTAKAADGGYSHKFFFYFSLMLFTSGLALVAAPRVSGVIFGLTKNV